MLEQTQQAMENGLQWSYKYWRLNKILNFLKLLERCWLEASEDSRSFPCIIVDNASIHTSKLTEAINKNMVVRMRFMPPYWPEVAPVEQMFKMIKAKIRAANVTWIINFGSIAGMKTIAKGLIELSEEAWRQAWMNVWKEWKHTILQPLKELDNNQN